MLLQHQKEFIEFIKSNTLTNLSIESGKDNFLIQKCNLLIL